MVPYSWYLLNVTRFYQSKTKDFASKNSFKWGEKAEWKKIFAVSRANETLVPQIWTNNKTKLNLKRVKGLAQTAFQKIYEFPLTQKDAPEHSHWRKANQNYKNMPLHTSGAGNGAIASGNVNWNVDWVVNI